MAKESLDVANLIYFFTIPSSLEAWLCDKHLRSYVRSFRSYFTHPGSVHCIPLSKVVHSLTLECARLQGLFAFPSVRVLSSVTTIEKKRGKVWRCYPWRLLLSMKTAVGVCLLFVCFEELQNEHLFLLVSAKKVMRLCDFVFRVPSCIADKK
jgi:hypothetical protein